MSKKLNNLLGFEDFVSNWNAEKQKATKRTEVGLDIIKERKFSAEQRKKLAGEGKAMPDGSFPIANRRDLQNAIKSYGRSKDPKAAKRHIRKRAKELGMEDLIPKTW